MTYNPNPTVTIGGSSFTDKTVDAITINYGRTRIWEQARAGYANVRLISLTDVAVGAEIEDQLVITIDDSVGDPITIFTGLVTDLTSAIVSKGEIGEVCVTTVTAYGPFAKMSRTIIGGSNFPKEYDDDRMDRILTDAGVTIDIVDTPGVYELVERPGSRSDAYSLAAQYAQMVSGYIYETTDGKVGYANESRRLNDVQDNGYMNISDDIILAQGMQSNRTRANIINDLVLVYKNNQTVTATDASSISLYGLSASTIRTELEQSSEAQNLANRYINLLSLPETNVGVINIQLGNPNVTDADRDALIAMRLGFPLSITGMPAAIYENGYAGFVEGWQWSINRWSALLSLTTTEATLSIAPTRWQDVDPLTEWDDVGAAVQWFEYE